MVTTFWLGTHQAHWLRTLNVPLFISRRRLDRYKTPPTAQTTWAMDSGGFTELSMHGRWTINATTYNDSIRRYTEQVGNLQWSAPQDWMCEPFITAKTGLTVLEHQHRTVGNYLDLKALGAHVIPVLQGYTITDYHRCADLYDRAGINLTTQPLVGIGSVCRRQDTHEIGTILEELHNRGITNVHGFGCKAGAVKRYGHLLASADSMAWSFTGRRNGTCTHLKSKCAHCIHYALAWRDKVINQTMPSYQPSLFSHR